jgi:hypothetical protein
MITARAEGLSNISEFWTAIGSHLRPSLNVKATISMQVAQPEVEGPPVTERKLDLGPDRFDIGGYFKDKQNAPVAGARIAIVELDLDATSDSNGRYGFSEIPIGKYQMSVNWKTDDKLKRKNVEISVPGPPGAYDVYAAAAYDLQGQIKADDSPLEGAVIELLELALSTTSDSKGHYSFGLIPIGKYTLSVSWKAGKIEKSKSVEINVPAAAGAYDVELKG